MPLRLGTWPTGTRATFFSAGSVDHRDVLILNWPHRATYRRESWRASPARYRRDITDGLDIGKRVNENRVRRRTIHPQCYVIGRNNDAVRGSASPTCPPLGKSGFLIRATSFVRFEIQDREAVKSESSMNKRLVEPSGRPLECRWAAHRDRICAP